MYQVRYAMIKKDQVADLKDFLVSERRDIYKPINYNSIEGINMQ